MYLAGKHQSEGEDLVATVNPLSKEQAAPEAHGVYDVLTDKLGLMPNVFAVMAHHPAALSTFMPFYQAVTEQMTLSSRDMELAYLATSMLNGCEY
jgi:alkylhydroperoxidase family enzyme